MRLKKPLLVVTLGHPGSGKTYFAERFSKDFNFFHLNPDKIRLEMFDHPTYESSEHKAVFRMIGWFTKELLSRKISIIIDANFNKRVHRSNFKTIAKKSGADFLLIHINTPIELAEQRIMKRRGIKSPERKKYYRPIDVSVLHLLKNEIEFPRSGEVVLEIDGKAPYSIQLATFQSWFKKKK